MSNYTKITNFAAKDSGTLDATRLITGTSHDNEYNAISVAIATKADTASPTLVTPNIGVATGTSLVLSSTSSATQYTSTIATGTAPMVVSSTTEVANLHAATATTATDTANKTGTGSTYVTNTSPTLISPALGTPSSGVLTNCTGLPIAGGGTGASTALNAFIALAGGQAATGVQGYMNLGAWKIVWGTGASQNTNTTQAISFISAFSTACTQAFIISSTALAANESKSWSASSLTTSGFTCSYYSGTGAAGTPYYFAIGY